MATHAQSLSQSWCQVSNSISTSQWLMNWCRQLLPAYAYAGVEAATLAFPWNLEHTSLSAARCSIKAGALLLGRPQAVWSCCCEYDSPLPWFQQSSIRPLTDALHCCMHCCPVLLQPSGVEVVKASTWEQPFYKRISAARQLELAVLKTTLLLQVSWHIKLVSAAKALLYFIASSPRLLGCCL